MAAGRRSFTVLPRTSLAVDETLTFQRVHRASHAAGALFRWCTTTLVDVFDPKEETPSTSVGEGASAGESDADSPAPSARAAAAPEETPCNSPLTPPKGAPTPSNGALPPLASGAAAKLAAAAAVAAINVEPTPCQPEAKPAPAMPKRPAPPAAPRRPPLTAATPPDRHFEILAEFDLGNAGMLPMTEVSLQTVAATCCMRPRLELELQACPFPIEHEAMSRTRVLAVQEWFARESIRTTISDKPRTGDPPGVICNLLLDKDRMLRDYFIVRENPEEDDDMAFSKDVVRDARMLEEDFKTVRH